MPWAFSESLFTFLRSTLHITQRSDPWLRLQPLLPSQKLLRKAAKTVTADVDLVRSYLRDIGRVPLLTHEQEITLGRQVQELMDLESLESELESKAGEKPSRDQLAKASGLSSMQLKRKLQHGRRAKERMVAANLEAGGERGQEVHQAEHGTPGFDPGGNHRSGAWC